MVELADGRLSGGILGQASPFHHQPPMDRGSARQRWWRYDGEERAFSIRLIGWSRAGRGSEPEVVDDQFAAARAADGKRAGAAADRFDGVPQVDAVISLSD
jgi:hypothetical protein